MHESEDGFSVVELTVVLGILLVIVAGVLAVLISGVRLERGQEARTQALEDVRGALGRVTRDVRQAITVDLGSTNGQLLMRTLLAGVEHDVLYKVTGGVLYRTIDAGADTPIVTGLDSADVFCYDPPTCAALAPASTTPTIVRITLSVKPAPSSAKAITLSTDVQLRNTAAS